MKIIDFIRIAAVTPSLKVGNTDYNCDEIIRSAKIADANNAGIVVFPELCITGATCGDLFYQDYLYKMSIQALQKILSASHDVESVLVIGLYLKIKNQYVNCAAVIKEGVILGVTPKVYTPNIKESQQSRWFSFKNKLDTLPESINLLDFDIPVGPILFTDSITSVSFALEVSADLFQPVSPSTLLALSGANIILNCGSFSAQLGNEDKLLRGVSQLSEKCNCGYVVASCGVHESTGEQVYAGDTVFCQLGELATSENRFSRESSIQYYDMDYVSIQHAQGVAHTNDLNPLNFSPQNVVLGRLKTLNVETQKLSHKYEKNPYLPSDDQGRHKACGEIFNIQVAGLVKRLAHTNSSSAVLGVSGGLDSTLALLVAFEASKILGMSPKQVLTITMPGFGTSDQTYSNALNIMQALDTEMREISIKDAVLSHFNDIGHDPNKRDITYENSQARERTQILMDVSNQVSGLVVGTGDLSEIALGWCTYNGDHMSMYSVNGGVPKTVIPHVLNWFITEKLSPKSDYCKDAILLAQSLQNVIDTPISPELLPTDKNGAIAQKTEDKVGPYILHDFFIYYTVVYGMSPRKLNAIANATFEDIFDKETVKKWQALFYRRFFSQQFKRNCGPDGPKIGVVGFSPRGDFTLPSDIDFSLWV